MSKSKNVVRKFPKSPEDKIIALRKLVEFNDFEKLKDTRKSETRESIGQKRIIKDSEEISGLFI